MESSEIIINDSDNDAPENPRVWDATRYFDGEPAIGEKLVTFDRKTFRNLFSDFPEQFTTEEIEIIREERPFWYNFFSARIVNAKH